MKVQLVALVLAGFLGSNAIAEAKKDSPKTKVQLAVTESGFEPKSIDVKPGSDVVLEVTRKTDVTCSTQIQIPAKKIKKDLPLNKPVTIALGRLEKGEIRFACGMDMDSGQILVK